MALAALELAIVAATAPKPRATRRPKPAPPVLDEQEQEVADLIAAGHGDRAIAQMLWLHPAELVAIDLRIRHKLGAASRGDVGCLLPTHA